MPIGVTWKRTDSIFMFGDDFELKGWSRTVVGKWFVESNDKLEKFDPQELVRVIEQPNHDRVLMILKNNTVVEYNFQTREQSIKMDLSTHPWDLNVLCERIIQISEEYCAFIAGRQLVLCKSRRTFYTVPLRGRYLI